MTDLLNVQLSTAPSYGDFPFMNYGNTDIPAGVFVSVDATNLVGVSTNEGPGVVIINASGDPTVGVTMEIIKAGNTGRVRTQGIAAVQSDGAVTAGTWVAASAGGGKVGYGIAAINNKSVGGIALNTSAADADLLLVLLAPCSFTNA